MTDRRATHMLKQIRYIINVLSEIDTNSAENSTWGYIEISMTMLQLLRTCDEPPLRLSRLFEVVQLLIKYNTIANMLKSGENFLLDSDDSVYDDLLDMTRELRLAGMNQETYNLAAAKFKADVEAFAEILDS